MDTARHKPRPTRPLARRPGPGDRRRRSGGGVPPRARRGTRSDAPREARLAVGRRPAMPDRPCAPEAGAANDRTSAHVAGNGHRFRLGVDQPDYLRLLRCFGFARAARRASVTRRASHYGFHPQLVSIQPEPKAAEADSGPCRELPGTEPSAWFGPGASPRIPSQTVRRWPPGKCRPVC